MDNIKNRKRKAQLDSTDIKTAKITKSDTTMGNLCNKTSSKAVKKVNKEPGCVLIESSLLSDTCPSWNEIDLISQTAGVTKDLVQNFVKLLEDGCTLPFIARYRKLAVGNLLPYRLQELEETYQNTCQLKKKIKLALENLHQAKKLTPDIKKSITNARTANELDLIFSPLKTNKQTLAEKARSLGLEPSAIEALNGKQINLKSLSHNNDELSNAEDVETLVTHIVADIIYKDTRVLEELRSRKEQCRFTLQSTLNKNCLKKKEKGDENKRVDSKSDPETYKTYFDWKCPTQFVKPHQTLAVNRGEEEKILTVKVIIPDWYYNGLEKYCIPLWKSTYWVKKGLDDAYKRLIKPWLTRQVRADLTKAAEKEAVKTFTSNLEKYLLTEPIKNRRIAGLDPGFKNGCKVGVIDTDGKALESRTIHPNLRLNINNDVAARQLKEILKKHKVEIIGLGNGTACRETEQWLSHHGLSDGIPVVIVPEQGASIYSVSKEAQKEHSNLDPNLISALSIARRVLDPLGELIKVDPKNLGVGLYQHDISPKMLSTALDATVERIVSLVGVDLNTASLALLRRISGLNESKAQKIIDYRTKNGPFKTRAELMKVASIGKRTFEQCAGFLKVIGGTEPLDSTIIHPESYDVAKKFANKLGVNLKDIQNPDFPVSVERNVANADLKQLSAELKTDEGTMDIILNAFKQKNLEEDMIAFCKPVYTLAAKKTEELTTGMSLTGVVRNVVPFGCFVDCGVGANGLVHSSKLGGLAPRLGDRVAVTVLAPPDNKKLALRLDRILE